MSDLLVEKVSAVVTEFPVLSTDIRVVVDHESQGISMLYSHLSIQILGCLRPQGIRGSRDLRRRPRRF